MNEKIEHYLSTLDRSQNTIETYRWALSCYVEDCGEELGNDAYEVFLGTLKHYSPSTKLVLRSAIMGLYAFYEVPGSEKRDALNRHYTGSVKATPVNFDRAGIEKTIAYCESLHGDLMELRDKAFVLCMADGGFRITELVNVKRGDIDWLEQRVSVVGKRNKPALVRLSNRSVEALRAYLDTREDGKHGRPLNSLPVYAQHGNVGSLKKMSADGMRKAIKQRILEAGVEPESVRIHDFRHYFVTVTLLASGSLKTAQELARHESPVTTSRYAHLAENELDEAYRKIFNK